MWRCRDQLVEHQAMWSCDLYTIIRCNKLFSWSLVQEFPIVSHYLAAFILCSISQRWSIKPGTTDNRWHMLRRRQSFCTWVMRFTLRLIGFRSWTFSCIYLTWSNQASGSWPWNAPAKQAAFRLNIRKFVSVLVSLPNRSAERLLCWRDQEHTFGRSVVVNSPHWHVEMPKHWSVGFLHWTRSGRGMCACGKMS